MGALPPPLLTCEPVLTEACFLIQRNGGQPAEVLKQVQAGVLEVALGVGTEAAALETLMRRYADTPMSLADACLVGSQNSTPIAACSRWTRISAATAGTGGR
jgi:hypothetical protein